MENTYPDITSNTGAASLAEKSVLVLHGPNLNMLGQREPSLYGHATLEQINQSLQEQADRAGIRLETFQSNSETALIEAIHRLSSVKRDYLIFNPAAFTHTSVALRDAIQAVRVPFIEVHLSNIYAREHFRHHSYFSDIATGVISGLGPNGYKLALDHVITLLSKTLS